MERVLAYQFGTIRVNENSLQTFCNQWLYANYEIRLNKTVVLSSDMVTLYTYNLTEVAQDPYYCWQAPQAHLSLDNHKAHAKGSPFFLWLVPATYTHILQGYFTLTGTIISQFQ